MEHEALTSIELFTGGGGLALGIARAGFSHQLLVEYNRHACDTLSHNLERFSHDGTPVSLFHGDVRDVDFRSIRQEVDLLAAGAPCQPFSIAGKHRAHADDRNLFPEVFRAQRELRPKAVIVENVRGLLRASLSSFVRYIELQLAWPDVLPGDPSDPDAWHGHLPRLLKVARDQPPSASGYAVTSFLLQAADYGVHQRRHRVFFVAIRNDLGQRPIRPAPTHSADALLIDKWITGDYWKRHELKRPSAIPQAVRSQVERLADVDPALLGKPWRTVRDALAGLPEPDAGSTASGEFPNHRFQPGAKSYPGHTGSPLDEPAKTLKAGVHGVPGGENMLRHPNGRVRYFTVREAARLQGFPDFYEFQGAWSEAMRQIGNAVPIRLAAAVAETVRDSIGRGVKSVESSAA